jgi:hypothetical protein
MQLIALHKKSALLLRLKSPDAPEKAPSPKAKHVTGVPVEQCGQEEILIKLHNAT